MRLPPYPKYKYSGVEWLGDVPVHWEVDRLKWTTTGMVNGIWGEEPNGVDDLICVRVADFDRERFLVVDEPPTLRAVDENQRRGRVLRKGDLLIEKSGGGEKQLVGAVVYFDHDFAAVCSNFVARMPVVPRYSARFWSYAHAALYAGRLNYPAVKQTTGIQNLDSAAYLDTVVGIPLEDEQRAIADFLDRETAAIDTLVAKKRTLIERLKEKRTALISRTVTRGLPPDAARAAGLDPHPKLKPSGHPWLDDIPNHWEVKRLKEVSVLFGRIGFRGYSTADLVDEGEGAITMSPSNMVGGGLTLAKCTWLSWEKYHESPEIKVEANDVIMVKTGSTLGKTAFVESVPVPMTINPQLMIFKRVKCLRRFLFYYVFSGVVQDVIPLHNTGSTIPTMTQEAIGKLPFPYPPLSEQGVIAEFLDRETAKLDGMVGKVEAAVERLQEYRTALITAVVTGKIDVRGAVA
jgi:type I restriction enzyme S subunit